MNVPEVVILPDAAALADQAARRVVALATTAVAQRERFAVALAGGATPAGLYRLLAQAPFCNQIDWQRTLVFFGDERCVPPDHAWSNYRMARDALLDAAPLPPANIFRVAGELAPEAAAAAYAATLRRVFTLRGATRPCFDLILLGLGDDGHTASLFPGMPALDEQRRLVVVSPVPGDARPVIPRITFTYPVLNAARHVLFLVAGAAKATAVAAALTGPEPAEPVPARRVQPRAGQLTWLLDQAAAGELVWK